MLVSKGSPSSALSTFASLGIAALVLAGLYLGQQILIPLSLAALLAFMLSPVVMRLEKYVGRIAATIMAVAILFGLIGGVGWILTRQVLDLTARLPEYQQNIHHKMMSLKLPGGGRFSAFNKSVEELKKDLPGAEPGAPAPAPVVQATRTPLDGGLAKPPASSAPPMPVEVVESKQAGPFAQLSLVLGAVAGPFGTAALVLLLLFCMLLQREDVRGRIIRLVGAGNISAATRGIDDAAKRVARFLLLQLLVNVTYGVVIGTGLLFIGVPNAFVWGVLATTLRFVPYVGAWIASAFPIALSLAVTNNWTMPLLTIGLFLVVELLSNNVMEPLIYGSSTGVSSIALIVAAVFWTWIWGPVGLVLATPLTVCLVVMGRHIPRLSILSVLLSDEDALAPSEEFYHRLLTTNTTDASNFAHQWLKAHSEMEFFDQVCLPALAAIELDKLTGQLEVERYSGVVEELRDVIEDLGSRPTARKLGGASRKEDGSKPEAASTLLAPACRVLCLPVRAERDEMAGQMLTQILIQNGFPSACLSAKMTTGELLDAALRDSAEIICISATPPSTVVHARYLCTKLRAQIPNVRIIVGLWGVTEQLSEETERLRVAGGDEVVTTMASAFQHFSRYAAELAQTTAVLALPRHEEDRLAELHGLHLLDTAAEPVFDRITKKLAHILNAPIALISFVDRDRQFFKSQTGLPEDLAAARETPRDVSVCSHVVSTNDILVVEDLARDRRFAQNSLLRERGLRFYAGAPLRTSQGNVLGALCVLDHKPRQFSEHERRVLQVMAEEVMEAVNHYASTRPSINLSGLPDDTGLPSSQ